MRIREAGASRGWWEPGAEPRADIIPELLPEPAEAAVGGAGGFRP